MNALRIFGAAALLGGALAACQRAPARTDAPLAGAAIGGPFALTDQDGRAVTEASYAGKSRLMYFGYTFCPDVCPLDLQHLAAGYRHFAQRHPTAAAKLVPIFVSVDPARDTPAVLKQYLAAFDPHFVGLTGSEAEIARVAKEYAVSYARQRKPGTTDYLVDHSRMAVLFAPDGKPLALISQDGSAEKIAGELASWVR